MQRTTIDHVITQRIFQRKWKQRSSQLSDIRQKKCEISILLHTDFILEETGLLVVKFLSTRYVDYDEYIA